MWEHNQINEYIVMFIGMLSEAYKNKWIDFDYMVTKTSENLKVGDN